MDKRGAYWLLFDPVKGSFYDFVLSAGLIVLYCACWLAPACWPPHCPTKVFSPERFFFRPTPCGFRQVVQRFQPRKNMNFPVNPVINY